MRTRSSNNTMASNENMLASHNAKRQALEAPPAGQGQPQRKRAAFGDITNAISNVKLHSNKKPTQSSSVIGGKIDKLTRQRSAAVLPKAAPIARIDEMMCSTDTASSTSSSPARRTTRRSGRSANTSSTSKSSSTVDEYMDAADTPSWEDPAPEYDYDAGLLDDPFSVPQYAMDIFHYYMSRETHFRVGDYMQEHKELTVEMRATLMDWLVETQENFELNHETLYQAARLADIYFGRVHSVTKEDVQLVGGACLFIASKFDERSPPLLDDFLYICDDAYTRSEFMAMERQVLKVVNFDIGMPLSYRYVRRYAKASNSPQETLTLARFLLETSLLHYEFVTINQAELAAAAFYLAKKIVAKHEGSTFEWTRILQKYSDMKPADFMATVHRLNVRMRDSARNKTLLTVHTKYSHPVFFSVATKFKPLTDAELA